MLLIHKAPAAGEVCSAGVNLLYPSGGLAHVEATGLAVRHVEHRKGTEHAVVWKHAPAKDYTVGSYKAICTNDDWLAVLPATLQIYRMAEQLGSIASDS